MTSLGGSVVMSRRGLIVAFGLCILATACAPRDSATPRAAGGGSVLALVGGRVQPAPDAPPLADGVVLVKDGAIVAVGARRDVRVPAGARVLDCAGATVTAGFWNSHVHFMQAVWRGAGSAPAEGLTAALRAMLTSWGFVGVVDTGSDLSNTLALRRRIDSGEVAGPAILIAGGSLVPRGGSPYYIRPLRLPEVGRAEDADAIVSAVLAAGADAVKIFSGSYAERETIVVMPVDIVRAAVDAAHRRGKLVLAHPSNSAGARAAIDGGVDILAHTYPDERGGPWDRTLPARMREQGMALIPTLKLWPHEVAKAGAPSSVAERLISNGQAQARAFADLGGQVLFGTDVGYMTDYDTTDEYRYLAGAGLTYAQILASLTTAPAGRFGRAERAGRLAPGFEADVTVVEGEPERDIRALARVRYTLRAGRVIFAR
jgi:imidazolonepropionase-like amidohydrolase